MEKFICNNIGTEGAHLTFAGRDTTQLAEKYGTPLYLLDEDKIKEKCEAYITGFKKYFPEGSMPLYASKANSFKQMYRIIKETGLGIDVVSGGEIATAKAAGFDLSKAYFHCNNKTDEEIAFAIDNKVGYFVVDHYGELVAVEAIAREKDIVQRILIRVTPGIDPHTYEEVNTGKVDSKFGSAIVTGQAEEITKAALSLPHIKLKGFHCHVGSMVFAEDVYDRTAEVMLEFMADMQKKYGFVTEQFDIGGGFGVPYVESDGNIDIIKKIGEVAETINKTCERLGIQVPAILMEPGRSIVADAGMTLYTCGFVKNIPGYKNYVSVDGGMTDNPRFALYGSKYTCYIANRMDEACDMKADLVGRCCESGDIIQPDIMVPSTTARGDIAAVCTTGAYNYSMASNYNRVPRPATVMLSGGTDYVAIRRETYADILALDK